MHKNATSDATSSGPPVRPSGVLETTFSRNFSLLRYYTHTHIYIYYISQHIVRKKRKFDRVHILCKRVRKFDVYV